jgi:copper(I)-binding protein
VRRIVTAVVAAACLAGVAGCGAGQVAATAEQRSSAPGSLGAAGSIQVRNAQITWDGPVPGDAVHAAGADAPLQVTIVNGPGGTEPDRLVAVSSPVAASARIEGDTTIPDGQALVAGYDLPVASITLDGAREVRIVLEDLRRPLRAGLTYPVTFTFARSGDVRLELMVENPQVLPPRARDGEAPDLAVITSGEGAPGVPG